MKTKLLGGVLLIVGTTIGAGMLALPIATASLGFTYSSLALFACWSIMTISAFLILEVNLWLPPNTNLISMARATLGRGGEVVAWITYLLLLYSLLAAYIAGGSDFLKSLLSLIHINAPSAVTAFIFTSFLGYVVFRGIRSVDLVNRFLMIIKLSSLFLLLGFIFPHVSLTNINGGVFNYLDASLTVIIASFGFSAIVPSLRSYFKDDVKQLRLAILIGSFIPLVCYILWNLAIMGIINREGPNGLIAMINSTRSTSDLINQVSVTMGLETITSFARTFASVCLFTSFLGVALCLADFLLDGFRLRKTRTNDIYIHLATLFPPLLIVLIYPGAFIAAIHYAGIYTVILLILLPALMTWFGRYRKNIAKGFRVFGGKFLLAFLILVSGLIILQSICSTVT